MINKTKTNKMKSANSKKQKNTDESWKSEVIYLPFRFKKIGNEGKYLVTNDYFDWIFVSESDLKLMQEKKSDKNQKLYQLLIDNNFIIDYNNNNSKELISRKMSHLSSLYLGPSLHIVVLTKRCNEKCVYCHATSTTQQDKQKFDLSKENAKKFVDIIMSSPSPHLTIEFQGGEPLLNFDVLKYIYEYSTTVNKKVKKDLRHTLVTNLELMDDEKLDFLLKNKIGICTSLDGPKFLHDKLRPSPGIKSTYDNALKWIKQVTKKGEMIGALVTVSRESLKYPKEIVDEYVNIGYNTIHLRFLNYLGKAIGKWKDIGYTAEEFMEFWKKAMDYIIDLNKKGTFISERTCNTILTKILLKQDPQYLDLMSPCGAIIGQVAYNYDGNIFTCDEARAINSDIFKIGDTKSKSIPEIIKSEKSVEILSCTMNDTYYCDYCAYKPYCGVCPVCNYQETGDLISDVIHSERCKIFMATFDYIFEKMQDPEIAKIFEKWVNTPKGMKTLK